MYNPLSYYLIYSFISHIIHLFPLGQKFCGSELCQFFLSEIPANPDQCLVHSRHSINTWYVNERYEWIWGELGIRMLQLTIPIMESHRIFIQDWPIVILTKHSEGICSLGIHDRYDQVANFVAGKSKLSLLYWHNLQRKVNTFFDAQISRKLLTIKGCMAYSFHYLFHEKKSTPLSYSQLQIS